MRLSVYVELVAGNIDIVELAGGSGWSINNLKRILLGVAVSLPEWVKIMSDLLMVSFHSKISLATLFGHFRFMFAVPG